MTTRLTLIAALARNRCIGRNNALPWHLPADLKHFRAMTLGKPVIMGRHTYESLGKPLPGRLNIIVSRRGLTPPTGCLIADSLERAIALCAEVPEAMIIGGARVYAQALERADRLLLTYVDTVVDGDAYFPVIETARWLETSRDCHDADAANDHGYCFVEYRRVKPDTGAAAQTE